MSWADGLHPQLKPWFLALAEAAQRLDPAARVTSGYRSSAEQARLYRRYLAGLNRFPVAPPGRSYHEYGRAIDLVANDATLRRLGEAWERIGGTWGKEADPIHFQA